MSATKKIKEQKEINGKLVIRYEDGSALVEDDGGFMNPIPAPRSSPDLGSVMDFGFGDDEGEEG